MPTKDATLTKETVIEMLRDMPDDELAAQTLEAMHFRLVIDDRLRRADSEERIPHEEFKKRVAKWLA